MIIKQISIILMLLLASLEIYADCNKAVGEIGNHLYTIRSVKDPGIVVEFFSNLNSVIDKLGEPHTWNDAPTDFSDDDLGEIEYNGILIAYVDEDPAPQTVVYMRIFNNNFETISGVRVGMTREAVVALYGSPADDGGRLVSDFDHEHGTSVMRYVSDMPYAPGGNYLLKIIMDEEDRVKHIIFTIMVSV